MWLKVAFRRPCGAKATFTLPCGAKATFSLIHRRGSYPQVAPHVDAHMPQLPMMKSMTTTNRSLIDFDAIGALFPDQIAKAGELIVMGLASNTIYSRCRPGGPWQRLLPGVLQLSSAPPTRLQLVRAALRYVGPHGVVTGSDALGLLGLKRAHPEGPVHVLIPHAQQVRSDALVRVERTTRMPCPFTRKGLPVAPACRAVLDATRRLKSMDAVRALMAECVQRQMTDPAELRTELRQGSNRGSALPRRVLAEIGDGVHSAAEAWARQLIGKTDLPKPQWNARIRLADGTLLGIVDAWWDEVGLAWEIDSYEFHLSPRMYADTLERGARLAAAGIAVVRTLPSRIRRDPRRVVDELTRAYQHAAARPRPSVVVDVRG